MRKILVWVVLGLAAPAFAQEAGPASAAPAPSSAPSPAGGPLQIQITPGGAAPQPAVPGASGANAADPAQGNSSFLGNAVPFLDPSSEIFSWDGKRWNISDQRVFRARFEKYLNAPEAVDKEDVEYRKLLDKIYESLSPGNNVDVVDAWGLLPKASAFRDDANLCDALADAVYSVWLAKREINRLNAANAQLSKEMDSLTWSAQIAVESSRLSKPPRAGGNGSDKVYETWKQEEEMKREIRMKPYVTRMAEIEAMTKLNQAKRDASELQAKIEFQTLIVQFFLQRRFQHVVIGSRFYRKIFGDGDTKLQLGKKTQSLLTDASGLPPTLSVLDTLANEAMRDVVEGVEAYQYLAKQKELQSATQRLAEAFMVGEYLPDIRTLPRERKREALEFVQLSNQLISAIEVKDYTRAEKIVKELDEKARDFDNSKPMAVIETAKTVSALHLAKAKNAAAAGDKATLEEELKAAMQIWPRNPDLAQVSGAIFDQSDVQQQALNDLERLMSQKNYRQIFEDRVKFIAATALFPDRQEKLRDILEKMQLVETAMIQANEVAKRGDPCGAWESVERAFAKFPEDIKLNQLRADLTTRAAEFVRSLTTAREMEDKEQWGSSLAWYLKAQQIYPGSEFAKEGIGRLVQRILPESATAAAASPGT